MSCQGNAPLPPGTHQRSIRGATTNRQTVDALYLNACDELTPGFHDAPLEKARIIFDMQRCTVTIQVDGEEWIFMPA